jgi:hypothetical protein
VFDEQIKGEMELDTNLTPELLEEGSVRELVRHIQDLRKKAGGALISISTQNMTFLWSFISNWAGR